MLIESNSKHQPVAIIALNLATRIEEQQALVAAGFTKFKTVRGCVKGEKEYGYVLAINSPDELAEVLQLARKHNQESILHIEGTSRRASLIPTNPESPQTSLGIFTPVDARHAHKLDSWTFDIGRDQFYVALPELKPSKMGVFQKH